MIQTGRHPQQRKLALRGALLSIAWALTTVWTVGHLGVHHEGPESVHHVESASGFAAPDLVAAHGHCHSHPQALSAAAMGKTPKPEAPWLLSSTPELALSNASLPSFARTAPARAHARTTAARRPRAPPLS